VSVPLCVVVVIGADDAGRVVWLEEHPAITIARAMAAIRLRRSRFTFELDARARIWVPTRLYAHSD